MMTTLILSMSLLVSSFILIVSNPLPMGLLILLLALMLTSSTSMFSSSWLALLVFLIYISGMLVLFSYFIAISPNQSMVMYPEHLIITIMSATPLILILMNSIAPITMVNDPQMQTLYSKSLAITPIILAMALLLALIIVVKLTNLTKGPLRPFL